MRQDNYMTISRRKLDLARAEKQKSIRALSVEARCSGKLLAADPVKLPVMTAGRVASALGLSLVDLLEDV